MSSLTPVEKRAFEDLLHMGGGYVFDFNNQSFSRLFRDTVNVDIYSEPYGTYGDSKANRMRRFWDIDSDRIVGKVLSAILELWKFENEKLSDISTNLGYNKCKLIVRRLMGEQLKDGDSESEFLTKDFGEITFANLKIEAALVPILDCRMKEATTGLKGGLSLSPIFMCGSILEGILLAFASQNPKEFGSASASPKDKQGKVKPFHDWTLSNLIDVAHELGLLGLDVKKFSSTLRDFRNYIHPYEQMASGFNPNNHTGKICMQVLRAAIAQISAKQD